MFKFKEKTKGFISGVLITSVITTSLLSFGAGILKTVEVNENGVKLKVNGVESNANTYIIDGRTYVQTRSICDLLDKQLGWDATTSTVTINDKGVTTSTTLPTKDIADSNVDANKVSATPIITISPTPTPILSDNSNFIFRKIKFGMTRQQVISSEGKNPDIDENDVIAYTNISIGNVKSTIMYSFNESNQLFDIIISAKDTHTNKNDYITDYERYKEAITDKYGKSISDDSRWDNDLYKDDRSQWGFAVSLGHLIYMTRWETEDAKINNLLSGDNYEVSLTVIIASKTITPMKKTSGL